MKSTKNRLNSVKLQKSKKPLRKRSPQTVLKDLENLIQVHSVIQKKSPEVYNKFLYPGLEQGIKDKIYN